jgi:diaminopimelate decarboxylase
MKLENGHYLLSGGINPLKLVEKYGSPLYVYEAETIERQFNRLKSAFQVEKLKISYACKALTNISILKFIKQLGSTIDCVSIQEVQIALKAGFNPVDVMYTPSGVNFEEIETAVSLGVRINLDNLPAIEKFGETYPHIPICVRINPHIMAGGNLKTSVGHIDSKFGISYLQMPLVQGILDSTGMKLEGLHMHTGSDILNPDAFLAGADVLLNLAKDFPDLDYIDFGSGFKVPYKPNDLETNIEELGKKLSAKFNEFCSAYGRPLTMVFEPGKFLVSEAGSFLVTVNVVKHGATTVFAGVDSGLNHLIRPMFYDSYHRISNISNPEGTKQTYNVVGYICETDTFASNREIPEIAPGDVLCLHNAGAYCYSMASNYNSRLRPAEVLIYQGNDFLIRERETIEDLLKHQIDVF